MFKNDQHTKLWKKNETHQPRPNPVAVNNSLKRFLRLTYSSATCLILVENAKNRKHTNVRGERERLVGSPRTPLPRPFTGSLSPQKFLHNQTRKTEKFPEIPS